MNKKEIKVLDKLLQYLSENSDRISIIRTTLGINTHYNFYDELKTIESLYSGVLEERKNTKTITYLLPPAVGQWNIFETRKPTKKVRNIK